MKLLNTSDWHFGQKFMGKSMNRDNPLNYPLELFKTVIPDIKFICNYCCRKL